MIAPGLHRDWREIPTAAAEGWRWPHFTPRELACKCGRHCKGEYFHDPVFLDQLEALRVAMGRPLKINSGRRCILHNREVKGAAASQHRLRIAADISVVGWSREEKRKLRDLAHGLGFGGIGYAASFLHLDPRPLKANGLPAQWDYTKGGMAQWLAL